MRPLGHELLAGLSLERKARRQRCVDLAAMHHEEAIAVLPVEVVAIHISYQHSGSAADRHLPALLVDCRQPLACRALGELLHIDSANPSLNDLLIRFGVARPPQRITLLRPEKFGGSNDDVSGDRSVRGGAFRTRLSSSRGFLMSHGGQRFNDVFAGFAASARLSHYVRGQL